MQHTNGFIALIDAIRPHVKELTVEDVALMQQRGDAFLLVDVREDNEWASGHITGAVHMGKGVIERDIEANVPDKNTALVLYCGGGSRSILSADNLQKMGYKNVTSMSGGWRGWVAAGLPRE